MSGHTILTGSLLALGVGIESLCCLGLLLARNVYDRLHFVAPASTLGPLLIAAAVIADRSQSQNIIKAVLIVLLFWIINPVLTHATARAARVREFSDLNIYPEERLAAPAIPPARAIAIVIGSHIHAVHKGTNAMNAIQIVSFLLVAAGGTAVVLNREPTDQVIVLSLYGILLTLLFLVLQAPDVALSELTVGTAALPLILLVTLAKVKGQE